MDSRGQILLLDSQALQYSMRQPSAKSPPSSVVSKQPQIESVYYQQSQSCLEDESTTETDIYIPQNLDPQELAYKFPPNASIVDHLENDENIKQPYNLTRGSPIVDWSGDSDSSRIDMRDTTSKDSYVPAVTDIVKYKLSWSSTISGVENTVSLYPTTTDIFPTDFHQQPTPSPIIKQMVKNGLSRHSSGYSNVVDDDDSASVGTEEFDNWIHGSKISTDTFENGSFKTSTRTFDNTHISASNATGAKLSTHLTSSPELTDGATNITDSRHSPVLLYSKAHNNKLSFRQNGHGKGDDDKIFHIPDRLVLEYKDSTVLIVESSLKELSNDTELVSESVLLPVGEMVTPLDIQHAAATKIQASWRGYSERKSNPPNSSRAMLLIVALSMKFQQKCNSSVDRKLRGLKHRLLQEARFRVRSERQLQKLGEVNRKERDELCRLLDNENITLEAQDRLMRESAEKVDVTYHQLQTERRERENLEKIIQLAAKEISDQAERELQRSKEMDMIQRKVEKLANELKILKLEQNSPHQRPRRSISPTPSIKSLSQAANSHGSPSPDVRPSLRHRMRPSAVPRLETGPSSSNINPALYQKVHAMKDALPTSHPKSNNALLRGKSLIQPTVPILLHKKEDDKPNINVYGTKS
ncbi:hypothetical protein BGW37DRAFT_467828 [Umbelopsis sp. PMI_123]|nr:hypothetical protein BGW37DRAFT_467828 [Umbelopsis sp. PMI_123]